MIFCFHPRNNMIQVQTKKKNHFGQKEEKKRFRSPRSGKAITWMEGSLHIHVTNLRMYPLNLNKTTNKLGRYMSRGPAL